MRTLWSLNGIRKTVGLEPAQKDTFKKMWSEKELKELEIKTRYGENIWNQVKDDIILSGMKRLYTKKDILRLVQTWNLAVPDLEGKEYLGDGIYRLYDNDGITVDYNIYNGVFEWNGTATRNLSFPLANNNTLGELTAQLIYVDGDFIRVGGVGWLFANTDDLGRIYFNGVGGYIKTSVKDGISDDLFFTMNSGTSYNNFKFKLQLEKGDTATPLNMFGGKSYDEMINEGLTTLQYDNQGHLDYMLKKDLINEEEYETYSSEIEKKEVI